MRKSNIKIQKIKEARQVIRKNVHKYTLLGTEIPKKNKRTTHVCKIYTRDRKQGTYKNIKNN